MYTIDPKDHLRIEREVENRDNEVIGVVHSHTTPSRFKPDRCWSGADPNWHYIIVSLKRESPETRCYRIIDGDIAEETLQILN